MAAATPVFRTPTAPDAAYRDDGIHVRRTPLPTRLALASFSLLGRSAFFP